MVIAVIPVLCPIKKLISLGQPSERGQIWSALYRQVRYGRSPTGGGGETGSRGRDVDTKWKEKPKENKETLIHGSGPDQYDTPSKHSSGTYRKCGLTCPLSPHDLLIIMFTRFSVVDPGCLSRNRIFPSRIPDPGFKRFRIGTKESIFDPTNCF